MSIISTASIASPKVHISIDGMSWNRINELDKSGSLAFFSQRENGIASGTALIPFESTNTGPAHASMYTALRPSEGGWISNSFLEPGSALNKPLNAFVYPKRKNILSLPHKMERKNIKTACINVPSIDSNETIGECSVHLKFSRALDRSCHIALDENKTYINFKEQPSADIGDCFLANSVSMSMSDDRITLTIEGSDTYPLLKGQINQVLFTHEGSEVSKLIWINSASSNSASIYIGPAFKPRANNGFFKLPKKMTPWPGTQDSRGFNSGKITEEGFVASLRFQADFVFEITTYLIDEGGVDAIFAYISLLDTIQHNFLVNDTQQADFKTSAKRFDQLIKNAYQYVDVKVANVASNIDEKSGSLFITSDHGMVASHTNLGINSYLESIGFSTAGKSPQVRAHTSGATAQIYINELTRLDAKITQEQKNKIMTKLFKKLTQLEYKGQRVFDTVLLKNELKELGSVHDNMGDIVAITTLGFGLDPRTRPTEKLFYHSTFDAQLLAELNYTPLEIEHAVSGFLNRNSPGIHGHLNTDPLMYGVFFTQAKLNFETKPVDSLSVSKYLNCVFLNGAKCLLSNNRF